MTWRTFHEMDGCNSNCDIGPRELGNCNTALGPSAIPPTWAILLDEKADESHLSVKLKKASSARRGSFSNDHPVA